MKIKIYKENAYIYPLGTVIHKDGFHISAVSSSASLFLLLYHRNEEEFCELQSVSQQLRHDVQHCFQRQSRSMNEIN